MLRPAKSITLPIAAAVILSGCGGSADNGSTAPTSTEPPPTGPSVGDPEVTSGAFVGVQLSSSGMFQSQLLDSPTVTQAEGDGAGGFDITYRIDGTDRTIRFAESDYGANPEDDFDLYYKELGNWIYTVESETPREARLGDSEFDHFDIYFAEAFETGDDASLLSAAVGYFVHGTPTQTLPTGTAEYSGRFRAKLIAPVSLPPTTPSSGWLRSSNLTLTLDFTDSTVSGAIDGVETRLRGQRSYEPVAGRFTIDGMIAESASGPGLRADMTGTEDLVTWDVDMEGRVFGPQAAEVGGVLTGTNSADDHKLIGYFGAAMQ